jgi:hypothetical protein
MRLVGKGSYLRLVKETSMMGLSEEYKQILNSAARGEGRVLLISTDPGEWYIRIGDVRLPEKQSKYASAKVRETVADLVKHGLLRFEGTPGEEGGPYSVTVKGFEECGIKE